MLVQPILIVIVFQHAATVTSLVEQSGKATGGTPMQKMEDALDQKMQRSSKDLSGIVLISNNIFRDVICQYTACAHYRTFSCSGYVECMCHTF